MEEMMPNLNNVPIPPMVKFSGQPKQLPGDEYKLRLVWPSIFVLAYLHLAALYGAWLFFTAALWPTVFWEILLHTFSGLGITAGAHRLWSHKSYKARIPLRLLLVLFNTLAHQKSVIEWARDHRVHHKYSETNADPHNSKRGFFFAHVGWLLCRKHPDIIEKGKTLDISDLENDPILKFQKAHYLKLMLLVSFVLPTVIPVYCWGETWTNSWHVAAIFRYIVTLNCVLLVNSVAHIWGNRPYDKHMSPSENLTVSLCVMGEGWHNYHHTFPWDYKTAELGNYGTNLTTAFIDFMASIGWAYDLRTVSEDMVMKRVKRTGDGTHFKYGHSHSHEGDVWGWGDKDMSQQDKDSAIIINGREKSQHYLKLVALVCFAMPTMIPVYCWGETWTNAWHVAALFRVTFTLYMISLVNSVTHIWRKRPYNKSLNPTQNLSVAIGALGEGWHNYHHTFPWDYKAAELGNYRANFTTAFIDCMAMIGWAYDLKTVSEDMVIKRVKRTGDGTHFKYGHSHSHEGDVWGWGDKDMSQQDKDSAIIINGNGKTQ